MKAIKTKYLGPTNTRGSRIKASDGCGNAIVINWDYELDVDKNHKVAAITLCKKMKWNTSFATGWHEGFAFHVLKNTALFF